MASTRRNRRAFLLVVIIFAGLLAQSVQALAINQASSGDDWRWRLDVVKDHPWWSALVLWVVVGGLAAITCRLQQPGARDAASSQPSAATVSGSVVQGPNAVQGSGDQRVAGRDYNELHVHQHSDQPSGIEEAKAFQRRGPLRVTYSAIRPLKTVWDRRLYDTTDKVSGEQAVDVLCDPSAGGDKGTKGIDVKVILYGAEHHSTVQVDAHTAAQTCRNENPDARILVAACDYAEEAPSEAELCAMVRGWGLGGSWDARVFFSVDELDEWLFEHLTMAIRSERLHGRWPAG